ncbi:MAG: hypothetical protein ACYC9L_06610 [Sulfuricaulis sp.]
MKQMPRSHVKLFIVAMAMIGIMATATVWADPTADLVNALDAKPFDGDAVRRAVAAGADVNVHICHQQIVRKSMWGTDHTDGAVKFADQCTSADGFWYVPVWAVFASPSRGPFFNERMRWVEYFKDHHAKFDPLFGSEGTDFCWPMYQLMSYSFLISPDLQPHVA